MALLEVQSLEKTFGKSVSYQSRRKGLFLRSTVILSEKPESACGKGGKANRVYTGISRNEL